MKERHRKRIISPGKIEADDFIHCGIDKNRINNSFIEIQRWIIIEKISYENKKEDPARSIF